MLKNNVVRASLFVLFVLIVSRCATTRVSVDYDKTVDFSVYKSFYLVPPKPAAQQRPAAVRDPFLKKEILAEIRPILEKKGFREAVSQDQADILVVFYAMVRNQQDYAPPVYRVGRWGRTWVARPGTVVRYKEGTLAIDIVDRLKKDLVWQGVGKDVLDRNDPSATLVAAVDEVLKGFPPRP